MISKMSQWLKNWLPQPHISKLNTIKITDKPRPWARRGYESFPIRLNPELTFDLVVDAGTPDPVVRGYREGYDENKPLRVLLEEFTQVGDTVLDLGAHVGTFALAAAAMGWKVIAVDASPKHVDLLNRSVKQNGFSNIRIVQAAVGVIRGTVRFHMGGLWGMVEHEGPCAREVLGAPMVEVKAMIGDELLEAVKVSRVAFMKMDIEGSEVAAVKGLTRLLSQPDAPLIVFECNGVTLPRFGESAYSLVNAIESYGYQVFRLEDDKFFPVRPDTLQPEPYLDLVAMKPAHQAIAGDRIVAPLTHSEIVDRVVSVARQRHEVERSYIGAALQHASPEMLADPRVCEVVSALATDSSAMVREAMAWSHLSKAG